VRNHSTRIGRGYALVDRRKLPLLHGHKIAHGLLDDP
jgi:hypothetical protein